MSDASRALPQIVAEEAAEGVAQALAVPPLRGTLSLRAVRAVIRWALRKAPPDTDGAWLRAASERRLAATDVRAASWALVLEGVPGDPAARAAALVAAALAFREELAGADCPERMREQCATIFSTTLLPREDAFEAHHGSGRHILVGVRGALHAVAVLDENGAAREPDAIASDLRRCLASQDASTPVLTVTSLPREEATDVWSRIADANVEPAKLVTDALFSVFFDSEAPSDDETAGAIAQAGAPFNRCPWHALQLVVFRNGRAVVLGNFAASVEGEAAREIARRLAKPPSAKRKSRRDDPPPERVRFELSEETEELLRAKSKTRVVNAGGVLVARGYGRDAWRDADVDPEAAVVIAIRLALALADADIDEIDCMVSLARYRGGIATRIDTATPEARSFVELAKSEAAAEQQAAALRRAIDAHRERIDAVKRLRGDALALHFAVERLRRVSYGVRLVVRLVLLWALTRLVRGRVRDELEGPAIAVDSSMSWAGRLAIGRFGFFAPPRSIRLHHAVADDAVRFVIQTSREQVPAARKLQTTLPRALEQVMVAARAKPSAESSEPAPLAPSPRVVVGRLRALLSATAAEA